MDKLSRRDVIKSGLTVAAASAASGLAVGGTKGQDFKD